MAFPPVPFQEWFLRQTSTGNAALNAYVARVKADGGVVEAIGCVPLAVWDWVAPVAPSFVGLLDLYPNAAAAYSLRKLRAAYSGAAVRVRKEVSLVSSETDIGFLADGTLDTVSLLAFASDADSGDVFVSIWYDQTQNDPLNQNNATQSLAVSQPKIVNAGSLVTENGKAAIDYNSSGYLLANFSGTLSQPNTIFSVCKKTDHSSYLFDGVSGSNRHAQGSSHWIFAGNVLSGAFPNPNLGNQLIFTALFNGASSEAFIDGSSTATGNAGSQSLTGLTLGRFHNLSTLVTPLNGTMQEFILFNSNQSTNRTAIETNINNFYSIYP